MSPQLKRRLLFYLLTLGLAGAAIGTAGVLTFQRGDAWESKFHLLQSEGLHLAEDFKSLFLEADLHLLRYELTHDPNDLDAFYQVANKTAGWLKEKRATVQSSGIRVLLGQLDSGFRNYRSSVRTLLTPPTAARPITQRDQLLLRIEAEANTILEIDRLIAAAQQGAANNLIRTARSDVGALRWVSLSANLIAAVCLAGLAWVVFQDLIAPLQRRLVESRLTIERQEKLSSLGVLAAGVAHEIRNPLTAIKARLFTQRKCLATNSSAREDNRFIHEEINRLERIVQSTLNFARPPEPTFQSIPSTTPMKTVAELVRPELEQAGIELHTEFRTNDAIQADPDQLHQVMLNLVRNAQESMKSGGRLTLRTRRADSRQLDRRLDGIVLEVEDNGPGIPPEVKKRLFDPFFSTKQTGTGLGLSTALRIVEQHRGALACESQPGQGARFTVVIPKALTS